MRYVPLPILLPSVGVAFAVLTAFASRGMPVRIDPDITAPPDLATLAPTLIGTVTSATSGKGIASAQLLATVDGRFGSSIAITKSDGTYRLELPGATKGAKIAVKIQRIGYEMVQLQTIVNSDSVRLDAVMRPSTNAIAQVVAQDAARATKATGYVREAVGPRNAPSIMATSPAPSQGRRDAGRQERNATDRFAPGDSPVNPDWNREQYDRIHDNPFLAVRNNPRSTFSVDVDRASYGNVRRYLTQGTTPPADAVRIEELINYFPYHLAAPRGDAPVNITTEVMPAPWQPRHELVRIALQARRIETDALPPSNLVFLIDVSGSMEMPDKLPLVKESLRLLTQQLRPQDHVALMVYAGQAGVVLPSTSGSDKARIMEAIDRLEAGGSTAGGAGIELAYRTARENFLRNGNNRVILATDGDFNVGVSSDGAMERLIESKRNEGIYLTVLGFGTGNYQDAKMEKMAKVGNGNYAYVDDINEARKVLVHEMGATLVTVANDVKLQIEFNPARVAAYRLIGYEDRLLRDEDFIDDKKDAGDMGAGHSVTALYEVVPVGVKGTIDERRVDGLRYEVPAPSVKRPSTETDELLFVKLRYKTPGESVSKLRSQAVRDGDVRRRDRDDRRASEDFRFATSVAAFGMLLRGSEHRGSASVAQVLELARGARGDDAGGYRGEFIRLVERYQEMSRGIAERRPGIR